MAKCDIIQGQVFKKPIITIRGDVMKITELRVRNLKYTLGTLVDHQDYLVFQLLLTYLQYGSKSNEEIPKRFKLNKEMPENIWKPSYNEAIKMWGTKTKYIKKNLDGSYSFTEKALRVLADALKKQKELDASGFRFPER